MYGYYQMTTYVCSLCKEPSNSCCKECTIKGLLCLTLSILCIISLIFWMPNTWQVEMSTYIIAIIFFIAMIRFLIGATLKVEIKRQVEKNNKGYNIEFQGQQGK